jgi:hypothetical protein
MIGHRGDLVRKARLTECNLTVPFLKVPESTCLFFIEIDAVLAAALRMDRDVENSPPAPTPP